MKTNLGDLLRRRARIARDREALVDLAAGVRLAYGELNRRANAAAHALSGLGVRKGDRIATLTLNSAEFVQTFYGAAKIGAVMVPLNWRLVADELQFILKDSGATVLFFGSEFAETAGNLRGRGADGSDVRHWIQVAPAGECEAWATPYATFDTGGEHGEPALEAGDDDLLVIMYTSGTTGLPKGVMHSHGSLYATLINVTSTVDYRADDRSLIALPLFHVGALAPMISNLYSGICCVLMRQFNPAQMWEVFESERITSTLAVPAMLNFMLQVPDFAKSDFSSLRAILSGASPVPVALIEKYGEIGIDIHQVYGLTESGGPGCYLGGEEAVTKAGAAGRPYFLTDLRVVDEEGNDVAPGVPGQVLLRGNHNMLGYWNRPDATEETLRDGWLHTGDVAIVDEDGYVTIHDRIKDMVISGGENIYPAELENVLLQHPDVADVAVIGQPSEAWGECTFAVVVPRSPDLKDTDIIAFCADKMARFKVPKGAALVDEIPRNPTGKPLKRILREQFPGPAPE